MLWGHKTEAFLDVWSIEHAVMGLSLGGLCVMLNGRAKPKLKLEYVHLVASILCFSFAWESLEHYLETGLAGKLVEDWFAGVEHWSNRLISDQLMVILGTAIYLRFPGLAWPARIFSVVWLAVHVFVFPHSMWLHEL